MKLDLRVALCVTVLSMFLWPRAHAQSLDPLPGAEKALDEMVLALALGYEAQSAFDPKACWAAGGSRKKLPFLATLVVVRHMRCPPGHGEARYEVFYSGELWYVKASSLRDMDAMRKPLSLVEARTTADIEPHLNWWRLASMKATLAEMEQAKAAVVATAGQGVAIFRSGVFEPDFGGATGFRVQVHNSSPTKVIKYVTLSVTGYNAVGDVVRDPVRGASMVTLRGIGPLKPDESATYSDDRMWHTELVHSARISRIHLEYTDGTKRVLTDTSKLLIARHHVATIESSQ
jgi:hypothetical protein